MDYYALPEGFVWTERTPEYLEFEHIASEKRGAVSHCIRKVVPDSGIQAEVNRACAKLLREIERDNEERARRTYFWLGAEAEAHHGR